MHHPTPYGASAYRAIGLETGVDATDPLGLVVMLYDGAIQAIVRAVGCLAAGQIEDRGVFTSKAIDIVNQGLSASLDMRVGGVLSESLWSLYEYMARRLVVANMTGDPAVYAEVRGLLVDLRASWQELRDKDARVGGSASTAQPVSRATVPDPLRAERRSIAA
jgi:flagellar protein FliS